MIGYGNEAAVFQAGQGRVVRIQPTYEDQDNVESVYQRQSSAPSGGIYVEVYEVGKIEGYDEEAGDDIIFAVYTVMEDLDPLLESDKQIIEDVVVHKTPIESTDASPELVSFMRQYMALPIDHSDDNVMMRGDQYVIIDPE